MKEIEKLISAKEEVRQKWQGKKAEADAQIQTLSEKLKSDEVAADYSKFIETKKELDDLKAYAEQIEEILSRESTPTEEEKATFERLFSEGVAECKELAAETGDYLSEVGKGILEMMDGAEAKQKALDEDLKALAKCYNIDYKKSVLTTNHIYAFVSTRNIKGGFDTLEAQKKKGLPL